MKCLALVTDAFGGDGGIARFNRDLLSAISAMPEVESVNVLCRHAPRRNVPLPPKVRQASANGGRALYASRALAHAMAGPRYDFVLCGHLHLTPVAALVARLQGIPFWVQLYGIEAWQKPGPLRSRAIRRAHLLTAISRYTRARFVEWADVTPDRVRVLPCTVDGRYTPGPKPAGLVEQLRVRGCRVLLTVSRIDRGDRYKGHEHVFVALRQLAERAPDLVYVIAGDGDDRPRLEQVARDYGLAGRVRFAGQVSDSELPDYYRLADVFVMPSAKEGFGIVFLEAIASGIPTIAGAADGARDALADGRLGTLVEPGNAAELGAAIMAALEMPKGMVSASRFDVAGFQDHVHGLVRLLGALGPDGRVMPDA